MKISLNWLKDFIKIDLNTTEIAEILTDIGLEVEGTTEYEQYKGGLKGLVVGKVKSCIKHPNADKLKLTHVDVGEKDMLQIICGAPNIEKDQTVVVATVGTTLFNNDEKFIIKRAKIRGESSEGMICSEAEIGLGNSHDGIMVLDKKIKAGKKLSKIYKSQSDTIFEIGLTPNRSDAMSHFGVARDLRAALMHKGIKTELLTPSISSFYVNSRTKKLNLNIDNFDLCPRFSGICIDNIKIDDSPEWLKSRLRSIGLSPINNVVDITNYVLHEIGQPLHAYDLDKMNSDDINIKTFKEKMSFTTLDGVKRSINNFDLMVCDSNIPMCIAGVYGGNTHGVSEKTNSIFLESAFFNPISIRKTSKSHSINSDASFRFERGVDIELVDYALKRAAIMICEICGGSICSEIIEEYPKKLEKKSILLNFEKTNNLIGQKIPPDQIKSILTSLDFQINNITETGIGITVPTYRHDISRECDVVEEILRIYGFNEINLSNKLSISINEEDNSNSFVVENKISDYLTSLGFNEIMNNSLTNNNLNLFGRKSIKIINSISSDISQLRTTLIESSLRTLKYNINRKNFDNKFFEFGKIYELKNKSKIEKQKLGIICSGNIISKSWNSKDTNIDFYSFKNIITNILLKFNILHKEKINNDDIFDEGLELIYKGKNIALLGKVNNKILGEFEIKSPTYYASFDMNYLLLSIKKTFNKYNPISKFPIVKRDLSFIFDKNQTYSEIKYSIESLNIKNLSGMELFDVYEGDKIPVNKKSYGINFAVSNSEKTLTEKEINFTMDKIQKRIQSQFNATLRDK